MTAIRTALATVFAVTLVLSGCGGSESSRSDTSSAADSGAASEPTDTDAPYSKTQNVDGAPTSNYIALCTSEDNVDKIEYFDATSGNEVYQYPIAISGNYEAGSTDSTNNQTGDFSAAARLGVTNCGGHYFNFDLTEVSGIDSYEKTGDRVPATVSLKTGKVTDLIAVPDHTGFDPVPALNYQDAAFDPTSRDDAVWSWECSPDESGEDNLAYLVSPSDTFQPLADQCTGDDGPYLFHFASGGVTPTVDNNSSDPATGSGCSKDVYLCEDILPASDYQTGPIRASDDGSRGAFDGCLEVTSAGSDCAVFTIDASGGEPTKVLTLPSGVTGQVIRYLTK